MELRACPRALRVTRVGVVAPAACITLLLLVLLCDACMRLLLLVLLPCIAMLSAGTCATHPVLVAAAPSLSSVPNSAAPDALARSCNSCCNPCLFATVQGRSNVAAHPAVVVGGAATHLPLAVVAACLAPDAPCRELAPLPSPPPGSVAVMRETEAVMRVAAHLATPLEDDQECFKEPVRAPVRVPPIVPVIASPMATHATPPTAVRCSVWQCTAVPCSVLQCVVASCMVPHATPPTAASCVP